MSQDYSDRLINMISSATTIQEISNKIELFSPENNVRIRVYFGNIKNFIETFNSHTDYTVSRTSENDEFHYYNISKQSGTSERPTHFSVELRMNYTETDYNKELEKIKADAKKKVRQESYEDYLLIPKNIPGWVTQIMDGKKEQDLIIFQDDDIIIQKHPDYLKSTKVLVWLKNKSKIYHSIRELDGSDLDMLNKIKIKLTDIFGDTYNAYFHYYPQFWQAHIHASIKNYDSGIRIHELDTVINNITLVSDYYQKIKISVYK